MDAVDPRVSGGHPSGMHSPAPAESETRNLRRLFEGFDTDSSGVLERGEVKNALEQLLGEPLAGEEEVTEALAAMDKDANGTVCFEEFEEWYRFVGRWYKLTEDELRVLLTALGKPPPDGVSKSRLAARLARQLAEGSDVVLPPVEVDLGDGSPAIVPDAQPEPEPQTPGSDAADDHQSSPGLCGSDETHRKWKRRRGMGHVIGVLIGVALPWLFGGRFGLGKEGIFRGSAQSYGILMDLLNGTAESGASESGAFDDDEVQASANGTSVEAPLWARWTDDVSLLMSGECGTDLLGTWNATQSLAGGASDCFNDVAIENAITVAVACVVFWYVFWLWLSIVRTARLERKIQRSAEACLKCISIGRCALNIFFAVISLVMAMAATVFVIAGSRLKGDEETGAVPETTSGKVFAFVIGFIMASGLIGAVFGTSAMERGLLKSGRLISTTLITGAALGVLCVFGYRHLSTSPVVELGRNPVSREVHDDATVDDSYYAVQMAKLYRERDDSFGSEMIQTLAAVACSIVWDVVVVWHHLTEHAHPKFRLRLGRRLSIYTHLFSGGTEIVCSIASFFLYDEGLENDSLRLQLTYICVGASMIHAMTGAYQTPQVFGMQCVMVPAYGVVVLWKVVCAARLALDPESLSRLLALFFTHHIYVWCRAFVVLLETIGIFEETTYTVGIIFAGFVMMPFALGPGGNLMGMGVISLYCLVILPYKTDPELLKIERRQNMFLNSKWRKHVETLQSEMHDDDKGMRALAGAQNVCSLGHANADWAEVKSSTIVVEAPASVLPSTAAASNVAATRSGAVVKAVKVKPGQIIEPGAALVEITDTRKRQHHQTAALGKDAVFDALDLDGSGELSREELVEVMVGWGVPRVEAEQCFEKIDKDHGGSIDRQEFFESYEPIWKYQVKNMQQAKEKFENFTSQEHKRLESPRKGGKRP